MIPLAFISVLVCRSAWAWSAEGHEIVAMIAANGLTTNARSRVAQILRVPASNGLVEKAMADASIRPDTEFREEDGATAAWHYIDICLQDSETDLSARCPHRVAVPDVKAASKPWNYRLAEVSDRLQRSFVRWTSGLAHSNDQIIRPNFLFPLK